MGVSPPRGAPVPTFNSSLPRMRRSRSRSPSRRTQIPWEDQETLRSLNCKACNVFLHDRDSMLAHLKGAPHLSQQQRLRDKEVRARTGGFGLNDVLRLDNTKMQYSDRFWVEQKGKEKKLRPEHERFLDTSRFENMPAKFDPDNYDHGQFKYRRRRTIVRSAMCTQRRATRCRPTRRAQTTRRCAPKFSALGVTSVSSMCPAGIPWITT